MRDVYAMCTCGRAGRQRRVPGVPRQAAPTLRLRSRSCVSVSVVASRARPPGLNPRVVSLAALEPCPDGARQLHLLLATVDTAAWVCAFTKPLFPAAAGLDGAVVVMVTATAKDGAMCRSTSCPAPER